MKDRVLIYSEWLTHQHRDTLASIVGHPPLLAYISIADGECLARERFEVIEVSYLLRVAEDLADDTAYVAALWKASWEDGVGLQAC